MQDHLETLGATIQRAQSATNEKRLTTADSTQRRIEDQLWKTAKEEALAYYHNTLRGRILNAALLGDQLSLFIARVGEACEIADAMHADAYVYQLVDSLREDGLYRHLWIAKEVNKVWGGAASPPNVLLLRLMD